MSARRGFHRRSRIQISLSLLLASLILSIPFVQNASAEPSSDPEREVLRIAKSLKPIPDDEWKRIAGDHITQKYEISKGDTLYDISKRLFGDPKYWPKIWALNNGRILNPHLIFPGNSVNFLPGTGTMLPGVDVSENDQGPQSTQSTQSTTMTDAIDETEGHPPRPTEWKMLPEQEWENVALLPPPEVDALGFDRRSRIVRPKQLGLDIPMMAATDKIQPLGLVFADEKGSTYITLDDLIFIHPEGDLQVGQTYSITDEPQELENEASPREGWGYPLVGKVKVLEERDGMFIGMVTSAVHPFTRGTHVVPLQPHVRNMDPIPGPSAINGFVLIDPRNSPTTLGQGAYVYIDRGSDDGVTPGMVFREYQHDDPNNEKRITKSNVLINSDIMIVQTSPKISTGLVLSSDTFFTEGAPVTLLTDVSDLLAAPNPARNRLQRGNGSPDELDTLDNGQGLNGKEKRELRQLEKKTQETPLPAPSAGAEEELPPPPAAEPTPESTGNTSNPAPNNAPKADEEDLPPPTPVNTPNTATPATPAAAPTEEPPPPPPADEPLTAAPPASNNGNGTTAPSTTTPSDSQSEPAVEIPPPPPPAQ